MRRILLTGGTGFLGSHITEELKNKYDLFSVGSKQYNLLDPIQTENMFREIQPEILINACGKSGGILQNKEEPATFLYENLMMTANIWEMSRRFAVKKIVSITPGCMYPRFASSPISEEFAWDGYPDEFPGPGACAKKMGIVASYSYKKQYGLNSLTIVPANLFGPKDHFNNVGAHVIPSLISRMHKAKVENTPEIILWGSGEALRDFCYVEDVAKMIPYFIENDIHFPCDEPTLTNVCNLSTGKGTSIKELAESLVNIIGFQGKLVWDTSKPEGPKNKIFSNERFRSIDHFKNFEFTPLHDGLRKTYNWYLENCT